MEIDSAVITDRRQPECAEARRLKNEVDERVSRLEERMSGEGTPRAEPLK